LAQLRHDSEKFTAEDTVVLVLGPEDAKAFKNYWQKNNLPFIGLPDPRHTVLKLYGQQIKIFKFGRMPAQVTIDKQGIVRFVHYGHDAADIPANEEILSVLKQFNQPSA
jgi:peroxiredoxin Q/BCP